MKSILIIIEEDILRMLAQEKSKESSLNTIRSEIKFSSLEITRAIDELNNKGLIKQKGSILELTETGQEIARNLFEKHFILKNYFLKTRNKKEAYKTAHILEHYVSDEVIKTINKLSINKGKGLPLTKLELSQESIVADIVIHDIKLFERLVSIGIVPGNKVILKNIIPNGVIIKVKNKIFALDKNIAKKILVIKHETP